MSLSVLKLFSLWPLSESLFDKVIEALFNLTQFFIIRLSSKATVMYFLSKKQFLTSGEKMTQKSNFLGKQTKITVSLRIGLRGKISQQQQIKLLFARKSQGALAGRFSTQHSPRSSNSRTPFVLHSKLSTLLSGLAGHSFSCSLYCILSLRGRRWKGKGKGEWRSFPFPLARPTRSRARPNSPFPFPFQRRPRRLLYPHSSLWALPAEVNSGKSFQFFLNGYIAICLVIDLLQCLSLRQLRSCNILFPTLSAIWMCQLDKCPANNFPRGTSVTVSSPAVYGFSSFWSTVFGKRRSFTILRYNLFALSCIIQVNTMCNYWPTVR